MESRTAICVFMHKFFLRTKKFITKSTGTRMKNIFLNEQKVGMLLQKRTDTRGVKWDLQYLELAMQ